MSKHTPGPWIGAGPSFGDPLPRYTTEIVTEREDEDGAATSICELPFRHHDDENEANARLIAAAPELLEALMLYVNDDNQTHTDRERKAIARAAINKATREHHE